MTSGAAVCGRSSRRRRNTRTRWAPSNRCDAPTWPLPGACAEWRGSVRRTRAWGCFLSSLLRMSSSLIASGPLGVAPYFSLCLPFSPSVSLYLCLPLFLYPYLSIYLYCSHFLLSLFPLAISRSCFFFFFLLHYVACEISVPWIRDLTHAPCSGSMES